jgi:hypothetical protein
MIPTPDNPFPLEAVATYGAALRTCEDLAYMQACRDQLNEYLIKYEKSETRFGCTIGLQGGHGSGKTHLLSWLGQQAAALTSSKPLVLYAKADRASFFDLYSQILAQLKRADLQLAIAEAVKQLAVEEVNKAEITRSIEKRLQTPAELQRLFREQNLDREALFSTLRERLQVSGAPQEITEALLFIESPTLGEIAYTWLAGKRIEDPVALGISYQLDALPIDGETTSIPDVVAVNALETLAALFAVARRPLIILIDQLEILLRTDADRRQTLSSVIKKLIEQLGRQNVLMFVVGTPEPWDLLPRDVAPRLRTRKPLSVGTLSSEEANIFLQVFSTPTFSANTLAALMRITGGNLREILRTSHHVFNRTSGNLASATPDDIVECARLAGTLDDRRKLALAEADQAFATIIGTVLSDLDVGGELPVDRLLQSQSASTIALITLTAGDRVGEAKLARQLLSTTRKLTERWRDAQVVVASVGYSTESIRQELGRTAIVIEYAEGSFVRALQGVLADAISKGGPANLTETVSSADFRDLTASIEGRLKRIEAQRTEETEKILEKFIAKARLFAAPEKERRDLKTRWDILDELAKLEERSQQDVLAKRESMRAVLVANETNIKNGRLDFLGSMYLDCVTSNYYEKTDRLRSALLLEMRRVLRPAAISNVLFDHPWRAVAIVSGVIVVLLLLALQILPIVFAEKPPRILYQWSVMFAVTALASLALGIPLRAATFRSRWNRDFESATQQARHREISDSTVKEP